MEGPDLLLRVDPSTKLLAAIELKIDPAQLAKSTPPGQTLSIEQFGWTAGAGIEYAFADFWTAKFEYLFVDFTSISCTNSGACGFLLPTHLPANNSVTFSENLVRIGVNYKFRP